MFYGVDIEEGDSKHMEFIQYVIIAFIGLASGIVVSSAIFSVLVALGAVNKTASILGRADKIEFLEWMIIWGAIIFNVIYLFLDKIWGGYMILVVMGIFFGIFIGIMLMALAEVTRVIPILYMRIGIYRGLIGIILATTFGKILGSIFGLCFKVK